MAVQWLNEALCPALRDYVLADSFVLRNRQLLVDAKRWGQVLIRYSVELLMRLKIFQKVGRQLTTGLFMSTHLLSSATIHGQVATLDNFLVFVGEKISLEPILPKKGEVSFDRGFKAKYKILTKIYGNYITDTIVFESYIHKGSVPGFSECKTPLLYLSKEDGKWYQEKYQYDEVFPTKNGRWAGVGKSWEYGHANNKDVKIATEDILFNDIGWSIGNYAEDLFYLRKHGVLKARGLF